MINKNNFFELLGDLLCEFYNDMKDSGIPSVEREQFINGYLTAARTLDVVFKKEMMDYIEKIHFEIFRMTVEERRKSLQVKPDQSEEEPEISVEPDLPGEEIEISAKSALSDDELEVPAYKRKGIKLQF
jgi:hypothetical protein